MNGTTPAGVVQMFCDGFFYKHANPPDSLHFLDLMKPTVNDDVVFDNVD
jgi:hypothetical protein